MTYTWSFPYALLCAAAGYIIGSFQTAVIMSKTRFGTDIRDYGSGNAGSTNMLRVYGAKYGLITFAGDFLKAVVAILLGRAFYGQLGGYITAFFCMIGHCFPVFSGFKGGKGVACALAIAYMTLPIGGVIVTVAAAVLFLLFRRISICSLAGVTIFPFCVLLFRRHDTALLVLSLLIFGFVALRHRENIRRLISGTEPKIEVNIDGEKIRNDVKNRIRNARRK